MRWAGHVVQMGEERNACMILIEKTEGKSPLGRSRHMCVDIIKTDFKRDRMGWCCWIYMAEDRDPWRALVNTVLNFRVT
jgi:hypothetical protein